MASLVVVVVEVVDVEAVGAAEVWPFDHRRRP